MLPLFFEESLPIGLGYAKIRDSKYRVRLGSNLTLICRRQRAFFRIGKLAAMALDQIEKVQQEYTDKYVQVDGNRAELARFNDLVGQVKTVNMSGRALVEFIDYNLSTGWYDIDLDYLKVVEKPEPKAKEAKKPAAKKAPAKPAAKKADAGGEKKLSPLELARQGDGAKKKKPSPAEMMAAMKANKPAAAKAEKPADAKVDRSKMSVADMLAAARGGDAKPAAAKSEPELEVEAPVVEEVVEAEAPAAGGPVDKSKMTVAEMINFCREKDA